MKNNINRSRFFAKLIEKKYLIVLLVISVIIEAFIFNYRFFTTLSNEPINPNVYLSDGTELKYNEPYNIKDGLEMRISNIDADVNNIHLGLAEVYSLDKIDSEFEKELDDIIVVNVAITDEGNSHIYEVKNNEYVSTIYPNSQFITIEPFGEVKDIKINISTSEREKYVCFNRISLNEHVDFGFNIIRFVIICILLYIVYTIFCGKYKECDYSSKKRWLSLASFFLPRFLCCYTY